MKSASLSDIKKELSGLKPQRLVELCLRLAKYKTDNKELLTYLLYEADNEALYIQAIKDEMDTLFGEVNTSNLYYAKKGFRKILRNITKYIRYSGNKETEITILIYFCEGIKKSGVQISKNEVLVNLYTTQIKKIEKAIGSLHEDLQFDYQDELKRISR